MAGLLGVLLLLVGCAHDTPRNASWNIEMKRLPAGDHDPDQARCPLVNLLIDRDCGRNG